MAKSRKDNKGRVLRKGEAVRSSNGMYQYAYMDAFGKRQFIYANDLLKLRQKEEEILRDCIIRTNPTHNAIGQLKKQTGANRGGRSALTPEEQKAFLQFMDGHPTYDHWKPIYTFLLEPLIYHTLHAIVFGICSVQDFVRMRRI